MVASVPLHRYHDVVWPCSTGRASSPTTSSAAVAVIIHGSGLIHRPVSSTQTGFAAGLPAGFALSGASARNRSLTQGAKTMPRPFFSVEGAESISGRPNPSVRGRC